MVASGDRDGVRIDRRRGELKKIERAIDGIDSKEAGMLDAALGVTHMVEAKRNIDVGDALQRTDAQFPI
jgi:hypothetical protein